MGRLVFTSRYGPTALPVVYRIDGESIVLGTWDPAVFDGDLRTGIAQADHQVAVKADQIDPEAHSGWFVLALSPHLPWDQAGRSPLKDLESLDAAFVVGTLLLLLIGIGIARVPFLDAPAGWAALLAECAGPALGYGEHQGDAAQYRQIAELCAAAGMDEAPVEACAPRHRLRLR